VSNNSHNKTSCTIFITNPKQQRNIISSFRAVASGKGVIKREEVKIKAPIQNPEKIICLGMNYVDHCLEQNQPIPEAPILFFKLPSSVIGHGEDIVCPDIVKVRL
jgi:2-keto-4-pentenoate hydratase/2-oxohepta-3-ene-1,7-dioic acid hydratase in catechol pathway